MGRGHRPQRGHRTNKNQTVSQEVCSLSSICTHRGYKADQSARLLDRMRLEIFHSQVSTYRRKYMGRWLLGPAYLCRRENKDHDKGV